MVYLLSVMGIGMGLNAGLVADSSAEADIDVSKHVADVDEETAASDAQPPFEGRLAWLSDPIEVQLIPDPYYSRLDAWLEDKVLAMTKAGLRYSLSIADAAAGFAYDHQELLGSPIAVLVIRAWTTVAVLAGMVAMFAEEIATAWRYVDAR
jgi:hypothetical protein